jgi:hypothetical protein
MTSRICAATKPDGTRCQALTIRGSGKCFWHHPAPGMAELREEARREAAYLGRRSQQADVRELDHALRRAGWPDGLRRMYLRTYLRGLTKGTEDGEPAITA